jgi:hypothetical protein
MRGLRSRPVQTLPKKRKSTDLHRCRLLGAVEKRDQKRTEDRMSHPGCTATAEIEKLREKQAAVLTRNDEFERRAEEDRIENERLAAEKLQNRDLARKNGESIKVKNELTGQNDELRKEKDDVIREKEVLIGEKYDLIRGKDELMRPNDQLRQAQ